MIESILNLNPVIAFVIGLLGNILGVAVAYMIVTVIMAPFLQTWLLRTIELSWAHFILALFIPFSLTLMLVLVWYFTGQYLQISSLLIATAVQIILSGGSYLLLSWYLNPIVKSSVQRMDPNHYLKIRNPKMHATKK